MATKISGTQPIRVEGGFITQCIRLSKTPLQDCARARMSLTGEQVLAIVHGRARIEGDNVTGYEYVEESTGNPTPAKE